MSNSPERSEDEMPVKKLPKAKPAGPSTLTMVMEAIKIIDDKKGASVAAIKNYIVGKYQQDPVRLKTHLKKALEKGLQEGVLKRPKSQEAQAGSLNGRYKLDKEKIAAQEKAKAVKLKIKTAAAEKKTKVKPSKKPAVKKTDRSKSPKAKKTKTSVSKTSVSRSRPEKSPAKKTAKAKVAAAAKAKAVKTVNKKSKDTPDPRIKKDVKVQQPKNQAKTPKKTAGKATKKTPASKRIKSAK